MYFDNFQNICLETYGLDPAHILSAPLLLWEAVFKKARVKLDLLTDTDMLLMGEKGTRGGICHDIHEYAKTNNK